MKIGIIGAGAIGRIYASLWHAAGHEVFLSARNPSKHQAFVDTLGTGASIGTVEEATTFGDVILFAPNYESADSAIAEMQSNVAGKLVIDATNPLRFNDAGQLESMIAEDQIAGVLMAAKFPTARIAKALTSLWSGHIEEKASREHPTLAMPFATDAAGDKDVVHQLIADAGLVPVDAGGLDASWVMDPSSPIWNVVLTKDEMTSKLAELVG